MDPDAPRPDEPVFDPATWRGTCRLIGSDIDRLATHLGGGGLLRRAYWFLLPNFQALFWYRLNRFLWLNHLRWPVHGLFLLSLYLHRVELSPTASIGAACLITHTGGSFYGTAGDRLTIMGLCGAGPWGHKKDVGAGVGNPLIGNDVVLAQLCAVLGPVRIGDGVRIGPGAIVMRDVPAGATVVAARSRTLRLNGAAQTDGLPDEQASE